MEFLHEGLPQRHMLAEWQPPSVAEPDFRQPADLSGSLKKILSAWNVCSKEWVIRQYDHEVQGGSVLKPLVGDKNDGPGDAAIIRPHLDSDRGIIISCAINPKYGDIDPYWMAASAIDEALRQIIAVGGDLERVALLDNFCWGNPEKPAQLGGLVRAAQGCHDAALAFGAPFVSGKDSLYNEYMAGEESIAIPPTLCISAMGVMADVKKAVSMDLKKAGDVVYIVGATGNELGGSHYYEVNGLTGGRAPEVDFPKAKALMDALSAATGKGLVAACHDCSEGGLAVAAAEMAFAGGLGMSLRLDKVPLREPVARDDYILFSESNTRFLVEVAPEKQAAFEKALAGIACAAIGKVANTETFEVIGLKGNKVLSAPLNELKEAWQRPLRW